MLCDSHGTKQPRILLDVVWLTHRELHERESIRSNLGEGLIRSLLLGRHLHAAGFLDSVSGWREPLMFYLPCRP